jgi:hypothetical protein
MRQPREPDGPSLCLSALLRSIRRHPAAPPPPPLPPPPALPQPRRSQQPPPPFPLPLPPSPPAPARLSSPRRPWPTGGRPAGPRRRRLPVLSDHATTHLPARWWRPVRFAAAGAGASAGRVREQPRRVAGAAAPRSDCALRRRNRTRLAAVATCGQHDAAAAAGQAQTTFELRKGRGPMPACAGATPPEHIVLRAAPSHCRLAGPTP